MPILYSVHVEQHHFHNSVSINGFTFYGSIHIFWCNKHDICFVNIKGQFVGFNPYIYLGNFFIDIIKNIIYFVSRSKKNVSSSAHIKKPEAHIDTK